MHVTQLSLNCRMIRAIMTPVENERVEAGSLVAIAWAIADDVLPFHYVVFSPDKTIQLAR